jgi:hypothetical protein
MTGGRGVLRGKCIEPRIGSSLVIEAPPIAWSLARVKTYPGAGVASVLGQEIYIITASRFLNHPVESSTSQRYIYLNLFYPQKFRTCKISKWLRKVPMEKETRSWRI